MKYTVNCVYYKPYFQAVEVEADSVEEARLKAAELADDYGNWEEGEPGRTEVEEVTPA